MARRKKKSGLQALISDISLTGLAFHPATLFVLFNIGLAATAMYCWDRYQDHIIDPESTILSADKIAINSPPVWAKTNIPDAILESTTEPRSLLDPGLIPDIVNTCESIGWIEDVALIEKTREGIKANLIYREPVAIVELAANTVPNWNDGPRYVPVDRQGVIMPDSLAIAGSGQPKIFIFHSDGNAKVLPKHLKHIYRWTAWPDARVKGAAAISELVTPIWQAAGLSRIISYRTLQDADDRSSPFEFWTDRGDEAATIVWGNAPGEEIDNEAPANQKILALQAFVQQHGRLDKLPPQIIDVRSGQAIKVGQSAAAKYRRRIGIR